MLWGPAGQPVHQQRPHHEQLHRQDPRGGDRATPSARSARSRPGGQPRDTGPAPSTSRRTGPSSWTVSTTGRRPSRRRPGGPRDGQLCGRMRQGSSDDPGRARRTRGRTPVHGPRPAHHGDPTTVVPTTWPFGHDGPPVAQGEAPDAAATSATTRTGTGMPSSARRSAGTPCPTERVRARARPDEMPCGRGGEMGPGDLLVVEGDDVAAVGEVERVCRGSGRPCGRRRGGPSPLGDDGDLDARAPVVSAGHAGELSAADDADAGHPGGGKWVMRSFRRTWIRDVLCPWLSIPRQWTILVSRA